MKRNIRKRLISWFMVFTLMVGMCTGLVGCGSAKTDESAVSTEEEISFTRGEWITGLASSLGMTEYAQEKAYFTDVNSNDELFPYVQSAAEWGLFEETEGAFEPEGKATREFVIATAVIAAEAVAPSEDDSYSYDECVSYALEQKLIENKEETYLSEGIEPEEAQKILDWSIDAYLYTDIEEKEVVVFEENVVDFREQENLITDGEDNITIASSTNVELEVGSIIILPATQENPDGIARKITSIETDARGNYVVTTETPELTDIFEELDIEKHVVPTGENIILGEGVTQVVVNDASSNFSLVSGIRDGKKDGLDIAFTIGYSSEDGILAKASNADEQNEFSVMLGEAGLTVEEKGEVEKKFKLANVKFDNDNIEIKEEKEKYKAGYSITGTLAIKDLYADVDLELKKALGIPYGVKELSVGINCDIEESLTLEGKFEGEKKITTIPVSIVPGVLSLNIDVILYVDANGVISVKLTTGNFVKYSYYKEKSKYHATSTSSQDVAVMADIELGGGVSPEINAVGICVIDMTAKVGVKYDFDTSLELKESMTETDEFIATNYEGVWKLKLDYYLPVVTLSVGAGEDCLLQLDIKKELIGPKGTVMKIKPENLLNEEHVVYRMQEKEWKGITPVKDEEVLEALLNAPANASVAYENFYETAGTAARAQALGITGNTGRSFMIDGISYYYSDEPRMYVDGRVEEGASFQMTGDDRDDYWEKGTYTVLDYNPTELTDVSTNVLHLESKVAGQIPEVGGFTEFLNEYECLTVEDMVEALMLGDEYLAALREDESTYNGSILSAKYGKISIKVESELAMWGDLYSKTLVMNFEDGSASPYRKIYVQEGWPANYAGDIKSLWVQAFTPAYYEGE